MNITFENKVALVTVSCCEAWRDRVHQERGA